MHGHQRDSAKGGTVWKCLEMPLSHCWRSALSEIHICLPETLEANFVWGESRLITRIFRFSASLLKYFFLKKTKMRSCNRLQADTYSSSTAPLYEADASFKTCIKNSFIFWFCCLTQNWPPKFQANKCGSQTMLISNNEKEAFPNISKQFHLLLNLFDVHAFRLHHLPVWYAIFLWTKPYIDIDRVLRAFKSLNH